MNGSGRRGRVLTEVDVKRLSEGLIDGTTLLHDLHPPIFHDQSLHFRRAWIVDPSGAFARDPIQ